MSLKLKPAIDMVLDGIRQILRQDLVEATERIQRKYKGKSGIEIDASNNGVTVAQAVAATRVVGIAVAKILGVRVCRECLCTEYDACIDAFGDGCAWVGPHLCSACAFEHVRADDVVAGQARQNIWVELGTAKGARR